MGPKRRPTSRNAALRTVRDRADRHLEELAKEAWKYAEQVIEPTRLVTRRGVTERVLGVEEDAKSARNILDYEHVVELLLKGRRPRGAKGDQTRHWAIWLMMNHLLEWSELDESGKEALFPYPNSHAAAAAVAEGFKRAGLDSTLTPNRVLRHYERHFESR